MERRIKIKVNLIILTNWDRSPIKWISLDIINEFIII